MTLKIVTLVLLLLSAQCRCMNIPATRQSEDIGQEGCDFSKGWFEKNLGAKNILKVDKQYESTNDPIFSLYF